VALVQVDRAEAFDDVGGALDFRLGLGDQGQHVVAAADDVRIARSVDVVVGAEQAGEEMLDRGADAFLVHFAGVVGGAGQAVGLAGRVGARHIDVGAGEARGQQLVHRILGVASVVENRY
jgi:hypothetical protein